MQLPTFIKGAKRIHIPKKVWIPSSIVLVALVIPLLVLGWMGLVPGLSNLMGSASQRNLGVSFTQQSLASFEQKTPLAFKDYTLAPVSLVNASERQALTQPVNVQGVTLSQAEVTAMLNSYHWSWLPISNPQVRFTNGTVEISGLLRTDHLNAFESYLANGQSLNPKTVRLINWLSHFRNNVPVYVKAQTFSADNFVSFKLKQAQIGRFNVPMSLLGPSAGQTTGADITTDNLQIQQAYITSGELHFSGTYPSVIYVQE
jgi:hypothetical protein